MACFSYVGKQVQLATRPLLHSVSGGRLLAAGQKAQSKGWPLLPAIHPSSYQVLILMEGRE